MLEDPDWLVAIEKLHNKVGLPFNVKEKITGYLPLQFVFVIGKMMERIEALEAKINDA